MTVLGPGWTTGLVTVGGFVAGLLSCFVMLVSEWGAWALIMPGRRLSAAGPGEDFETGPAGGEPIEATARDGTRLAGVWYPAGSSPTGRTVLLVHGFAEIRDAMKGRAEFLTARGWNVARLDMRGYGRSGGGCASFGGREGDDLRAWVDVVAGRVGPAMSLAVWGRSMGAAIAMRAAADEPRIAAVLLESPYARLETVVAGWLRRIRTPLAEPARPSDRAPGRPAGGRLLEPSSADRAGPPDHGADSDRSWPARHARPRWRRAPPGLGLPPAGDPHRSPRRRARQRHRDGRPRPARSHRRVPGSGRGTLSGW